MKKIMTLLTMLMIIVTSCTAAENEEPQLGSEGNGEYFNGKKVLVAYFSWGGTTRRMAEAIQETTQGDIFEIEPVVPYPTSYTPCTEVALEERDNDARPAIKDKVADWDKYDIVFIGCPVWWHTAPMIISTFAEIYNFEGKQSFRSAHTQQPTAMRPLRRLLTSHLRLNILKVLAPPAQLPASMLG